MQQRTPQADEVAQANAILAAGSGAQDQLLPVSHAIQDTIGYIPPDSVVDDRPA